MGYDVTPTIPTNTLMVNIKASSKKKQAFDKGFTHKTLLWLQLVNVAGKSTEKSFPCQVPTLQNIYGQLILLAISTLAVKMSKLIHSSCS